MGDILEEASSYLECKECPWYKSCVTPMRLRADDLMKEMRQFPSGAQSGTAGDQEFRNLLVNMAAMAQNVLLEGCPIFVERLKSNPQMAQQLKKMMQNWGSGEEQKEKD